jgi:hypothetical protein
VLLSRCWDHPNLTPDRHPAVGDADRRRHVAVGGTVVGTTTLNADEKVAWSGAAVNTSS